MPSTVLARPAATDYAEYFGRYISQVPEGDLVAICEKQIDELPALLKRVSPANETYRYAPNKWSIREVMGHITDAERVFSYRATHMSRGDASPLPSFDQDAWTPMGEYDSRTLADLVEEWITVRRAAISLIRGMPESGLQRKGTASGKEISALAVLCLIPGHVQFHIGTFQKDYGAAFA